MVIELVYTSTDYNLSDIFTKALPEVKFTKFREMMGIT